MNTHNTLQKAIREMSQILNRNLYMYLVKLIKYIKQNELFECKSK